MFIGDTVEVRDDGAVLLTQSKKKVKNIAIFLKEGDSEDEKENKDNNVDINPATFGRGKRSAVLEQKLRTDSTTEQKRKQHQKDLLAKMNAAALQRLNEGKKEDDKVGFNKRRVKI